MESSPMKFEEYHRQKQILEAIEQASNLSLAALERERGISEAGDTNAGRSWRAWTGPENQLCTQLDEIIARAREKGWVNEQTLAIREYTKRKKQGLAQISRRVREFAAKQAALSAALHDFREVCRDAYARTAEFDVPPIWISVGDTEDTYQSFPLCLPDIEKEFEKAQAAMEMLLELELNLQHYPEPDPVTNRSFLFTRKFHKKPQ